VDTDLSPANGDLVVVIVEGRASIKRYTEDAHGGKWLTDNEGRYQPDGARIHGVVMEYVRKLR